MYTFVDTVINYVYCCLQSLYSKRRVDKERTHHETVVPVTEVSTGSSGDTQKGNCGCPGSRKVSHTG